MDVGQPTLDQLRIFIAVADEGSFNRAARKLGRALSVISYGVDYDGPRPSGLPPTVAEEPYGD